MGGSTTFPSVRDRAEVGMDSDLPPTGRTAIGRCSGADEGEFKPIMSHCIRRSGIRTNV